jgi:hypothetical protein
VMYFPFHEALGAVNQRRSPESQPGLACCPMRSQWKCWFGRECAGLPMEIRGLRLYSLTGLRKNRC